MLISALVVTYHRPQWLERCVRSLIASAKNQLEIGLSITVLVNGEDAKSVEILDRLAVEFPRSISKVIKKLDRATPSKARNEALVHTTGEWILFIDDDAYVEEEFFRSFISASSEFPQSAAIGGPNLTPPNSSVFQIATGFMLSSRLGAFSSYSRYRGTGVRRNCSEEALILCNLFVKKSVLDAKPFPEWFLCGEENWLIQTLRSHGHHLTYAPDMSVRHERRAALVSFLKQAFIYGFGRGQNMKLRPSTFRVPHIFPSVCALWGFFALGELVFTRAVPLVFFRLAEIYALLCLLVSFSNLRFSKQPFLASLLCPFLFPLLHVAYGLGVLRGLVADSRDPMPVSAPSTR